MSSFIQIPIEQKVGKGNRILRPLKRDPMIEVSAYRDNQFKVWRHHNVILTKYYVIITGNDVILGNTPGTRSTASHHVHPLHREFEFLHNRRADYRIIWKMWRSQKSSYGTGQSQTSKFPGLDGLGRIHSVLFFGSKAKMSSFTFSDTVRFLLCWILHTWLCRECDEMDKWNTSWWQNY